MQHYYTFDKAGSRLQQELDYTIDERTQAISLTTEGIGKMERWTRVGNLYDLVTSTTRTPLTMENALTAHVQKKRDKDYVVRDGDVVIVDEFTGRLQFGRRWSDGLHQAVEAKEGIKIQRESVTYATVTLQNYFRMYEKLAGMTGTAATESDEFFKIYRLEVATIPTNMPMIRDDASDLVYQNNEGKWRAVVNDIVELNQVGRPILVGTTSIESSEQLSERLKRRGVAHQVLNAKNHQHEADIVAQAGRLGAVIVSTNMAGRGTDIVLGGSDTSRPDWQEEHGQVVRLGGLHVLGTEHHDARRVDNQLRGRSGRQGDPGSSQFYVSLEDELMQRFGGDRIKSFVGWAGLEEDTPIENKLITKSISGAQVKVESYHFDIRKHLLDYDGVFKPAAGDNLRGPPPHPGRGQPAGQDCRYAAEGVLRPGERPPGQPPHRRLECDQLHLRVGPHLSLAAPVERRGEGVPAQPGRGTQCPRRLRRPGVRGPGAGPGRGANAYPGTAATAAGHRRALGEPPDSSGEPAYRHRLHAYGQRDPLVMYRTEGHKAFQEFLQRMQYDVVHTLFHVTVAPQSGNGRRQREADLAQASPMQDVTGKPRRPVAPANGKIGRNARCPCGSGKKYKRCCGAGN